MVVHTRLRSFEAAFADDARATIDETRSPRARMQLLMQTYDRRSLQSCCLPCPQHILRLSHLVRFHRPPLNETATRGGRENWQRRGQQLCCLSRTRSVGLEGARTESRCIAAGIAMNRVNMRFMEEGEEIFVASRDSAARKFLPGLRRRQGLPDLPAARGRPRLRCSCYLRMLSIDVPYRLDSRLLMLCD